MIHDLSEVDMINYSVSTHTLDHAFVLSELRGCMLMTIGINYKFQ